MLKKKIINWFSNPHFVYELLISAIKKKFITQYENYCKNFFKNKNLLTYFISGKTNEFIPEFIDLKNLYKQILYRKPKCVLEFGVGFTTICIALALKENTKKGFHGKLYTVDSEEDWLRNTEEKLPNELKKFVTFHPSPCSVHEMDGQLVTLYDNLPNISPNFIYLDGPSPQSVKGQIHGLGFFEKNSTSQEMKFIRRIVAADILLYESSAPADFFYFG